jgi:hypothetical protein
MTEPEPAIRVKVDPTNPGQFFACCGLLELADRLWPGAEGWFAESGREFRIHCGTDLPHLIQTISRLELIPLDEDDKYSTRIRIVHTERPLDLDWWHELGGRPDAKDLKVWAGTMESLGIAKAMQRVMQQEQFHHSHLFDIGMVVPDSENPANKKEPYYFDARRGPNAHSRDVGFSPNDLSLTTIAYPAVEWLCLVGLQRGLPARTEQSRVYDYHTWTAPIPPELLPVVVAGELSWPGSRAYRFENWFRTGQKKHKAFRAAIPIIPGD